MPTRALITRHTCSAHNAYTPSRALFSTLLLPLKRAAHTTEPTLQCRDHAWSPNLLHIKARKRAVLCFSVNHGLKQKPQATQTPDVVQPKAKLGVGATYLNYDALKSATRAPKKTETTTTIVVRHRDSPVKPRKLHPATPSGVVTDGSVTTKFQHKVEPTSRQGPQFVDVDREDGNTHDWQRFMQRIAGYAWQLSKMKVDLKDTKAIEAGRKRLDYNAWYLDAPRSPKERRLPIPWRINLTESSGLQGTQLLDHEIQSFARYLDCSPAEQAARETVISETSTVISDASLGLQSEVFGSQVTGLATTTSDIDIRLSWIGGEGTTQRNLRETMRTLRKAFTDSNEFICIVMRYSKFPIITAQHKRTGIDLQIVFAPDTKPQQDVTADFLREIPHIRSVYAALKTAFGIRGLVDVVNGGIGSYGLFMMLVASLKRRSSDPPTTASAQLLRFLDFYSDLDVSKYGVSAEPPKLFKKHDAWELPIKAQIDAARRRGDTVRAGQWAIGQRRLYQPYLLCLQDPADSLNDLGRKSNAIKHLQRTIVVLRNTVNRHMADISDAVARRAPWTEDSTLLPLVGRCHEIYYERRKKAEEYGLQIMMKRQEGAIAKVAG